MRRSLAAFRDERAICAQPMRAMGATVRMRRLPIN